MNMHKSFPSWKLLPFFFVSVREQNLKKYPLLVEQSRNLQHRLSALVCWLVLTMGCVCSVLSSKQLIMFAVDENVDIVLAFESKILVNTFDNYLIQLILLDLGTLKYHQ